MKNKGRIHKTTSMNCKGWLTHLTRPVESMASRHNNGSPGFLPGASSKFNKRKWSKRVRGYFKSQTKELL